MSALFRFSQDAFPLILGQGFAQAFNGGLNLIVDQRTCSIAVNVGLQKMLSSDASVNPIATDWFEPHGLCAKLKLIKNYTQKTGVYMFIRTLLVSALFLALSCVSLQASTDTSFDVPSNTTDDTVLLLAGVKDRRKGNQGADECDAADACYDKCGDDDDDCFDACEDKYPNCPDCEDDDDDCD